MDIGWHRTKWRLLDSASLLFESKKRAMSIKYKQGFKAQDRSYHPHFAGGSQLLAAYSEEKSETLLDESHCGGLQFQLDKQVPQAPLSCHSERSGQTTLLWATIAPP